MWAAGTASVLLTLALCGAEDLPLKWSKPASERSNGDWVPLSADQLGQASARSLGPPPQQNHLVHGIFQENSNSFGQPFHQQQHFREPPHHQEKYIQPHILQQQFQPPPPPPPPPPSHLQPHQIPPHLISQQISPQFLNQQFENNFNPQIPPARPVLRQQYVVSQDQYNQQQSIHTSGRHPQQHPDEFFTEQNIQNSNFHNNPNIPHQHSFSLPKTNTIQTPKALSEHTPTNKNPHEEKEEVQILYVPVETLKQRGRGQPTSKNIQSNQPIQPTPTSTTKESKKFRHPIQPLKDQVPASHLRFLNAGQQEGQIKTNENPLRPEYDSVKDTSQQISTSQQRQNHPESKLISPVQQSWESKFPVEPPVSPSNFRDFNNDDRKEQYQPQSKEEDSYNQYSQAPPRSLLKQTFDQSQQEHGRKEQYQTQSKEEDSYNQYSQAPPRSLLKQTFDQSQQEHGRKEQYQTQSKEEDSYNQYSQAPPRSLLKQTFDQSQQEHGRKEQYQTQSKEEGSYNQYSQAPPRSLLKQTFDHSQQEHGHLSRPTEAYQDVTTSKLPPPNQPPLSVYMETSPNSKVGDVLSLLKDAKTIPVLDTIGPDSPQVFVGPSNLKPPHGYVKFELPYLSSLDGNRVERKVLQLPFFVAPLNFQPPPGYSKIPFPPPHIGSVVLSNTSARAITEKYAVTPSPSYSPSSTFRDPYTIPADISSISPQLPSLINSLQEEEQLSSSTTSSTAATTIEDQTEPLPETTTGFTRRPHNSRRNNFRGSQRANSASTSTSPPRRPYSQRQRRPYNGRTQSRFNQITSTTTTTTEESESSPTLYDNNSYLKNGQEVSDQLSHHQHTDQYSSVNSQTPTQSTDDSISSFVSKQAVSEDEIRQYNSKTKNNDDNFHKQQFAPQYTNDFIPRDYSSSEDVDINNQKPVSQNQNFPSFPHPTRDSFNNNVKDNYQTQFVHREQQSDDVKHYQPVVDSTFSSGPVNYEQDRQSIKSEFKDEVLSTKQPENYFTTTESTKTHQYYKEDSDELSRPPNRPQDQYKENRDESFYTPAATKSRPYKGSDHLSYISSGENSQGQTPLNIQQVPYSIPDYKPDPKEERFIQEPQEKPLNTQPIAINPFGQDYTQNPNPHANYDVEMAKKVHEQTSSPRYQDYLDSSLNEREPSLTSNFENKETISTPTNDAYKPEYQQSSDERTNYRTTKHKQRGRPSKESESRTTTDQYLETTTTSHTEKTTNSRGRSRLRGRPLYTRQKTTTEAPNYPSIFTESKEPSPTTESYKEDKRISSQYSSDSDTAIGNYEINDYSQHTTTQGTTESTTRAINKKYSHSRNIHRRPLRPTSTSPPSTTTATSSAPSGTRYLIRTRRPANPQTKLHSGRGRIRRPTTPTTTTTTEAVTEITEKWTVPQLPNLSYNKDDDYSQVQTKLSQYDTFSRSPFAINANNDDKLNLYQTTPVNVPDLSSNVRYVEKAKPTNPSLYEEHDDDDDVAVYTTRKTNLYRQRDPQPTIISYNDEPSYKTSEQEQRDSEGYSNLETGRKTVSKNRDVQTASHSHANKEDSLTSYKQSRGKQRGQQPITVYHEESFVSNVDKTYETTRKPQISRHKDTQLTSNNEQEEKRNYKSFESPIKVPAVQQNEPQPTSPTFVADEDPYNQNFKGFATTRKSPVYKQNDPELDFENKYIPDKSPGLIPDFPEQNYKSKTSQQKEAEDFWNQAVTIQQSQSYVYMPDTFTTPSARSSKSGSSNSKSSGAIDLGFNEYDDYFAYQDGAKYSSSDQAPFPSNEQQVTYTGLKPNFELGKESQYPEKESNDGTKIDGKFKPESNMNSEVTGFSNDQINKTIEEQGVKEINLISTEGPSYHETSSTAKAPGKRRGTWVRVRVKKPKDVFETAESQRFGSLTSNSLQGNQKLKIDGKVWDSIKVAPNSTAQEIMEKMESLVVSNATNSEKPSIMEQFQNTLTSMITSYMKIDDGTKTEKTEAVETSTEITTEVPDLTTFPPTTEEDHSEFTTEIPITSSTNTLQEIQTTTDSITASENASTFLPKVLGTSTTTEISLETEICFRGRCVKTKRSKNGKEESDLMTVE